MAAKRNSSATVGLVAIMKNIWSLAYAFACYDISERYLHIITNCCLSTINKDCQARFIFEKFNVHMIFALVTSLPKIECQQ